MESCSTVSYSKESFWSVEKSARNRMRITFRSSGVELIVGFARFAGYRVKAVFRLVEMKNVSFS